MDDDLDDEDSNFFNNDDEFHPNDNLKASRTSQRTELESNDDEHTKQENNTKAAKSRKSKTTVDKKSSTKNKRKSSTHKKGVKNNTNNHESRNKRQRPKPPPNPPASLIKLLQNDTSVLQYFQSLQENLQADVDIWKERANKWKLENDSLKQQLASLQSNNEGNKKDSRKRNRKSNKTTKATNDADEFVNKKESGDQIDDIVKDESPTRDTNYIIDSKTKNESDSVDENNHNDDGHVPVDESMFDDVSSDSEDDSSNPPTKTEVIDPLTQQNNMSTNESVDEKIDDADSVPDSEFNFGDDDDDDDDDSCVNIKAKSNSSRQKGEENEPPPPAKINENLKLNKTKRRSKVKKENTFFHFSSSDTSDSEESNNTKDVDVQMEIPVIKTKSPLTTARNKVSKLKHTKEAEKIFFKLLQTYEILTNLGINLVNIEQGQETTKSTMSDQVSTTIRNNDTVKEVKMEDLDTAPAYSSPENTDQKHDENFATEYLSDSDSASTSSSIALNSSNEDDEFPRATVGTKRSRVTRRNDADVAADILHSIHLVCQMKVMETTKMNDHPLFVGDNLIPCCNIISEHHPAAMMTDNEKPIYTALDVKKLIFKILICFETFCSPSIPKDEWESYFVVGKEHLERQQQDCDDNDKQPHTDQNLKVRCMKVGLRGRQALVEKLIISLENEISEGWACSDRTSRLSMIQTHLKDDEMEGCQPVALYDDYDKCEADLGGAKTQSKLSGSIEHCMICQIVFGVLLSNDEVQRAIRLIFSYLISTVPAIPIEDYPKLPPVFSFLSFEAMINPDPDLLVFWSNNVAGNISNVEDWFKSESTWFGNCLADGLDSREMDLVASFIGHAIVLNATIFQQRLLSSNSHIHNIAVVELASFRRVQKNLSSLVQQVSEIFNPEVKAENILAITAAMLKEHSSADEICNTFGKNRSQRSLLAFEGLIVLLGNVNFREVNVETRFRNVTQLLIRNETNDLETTKVVAGIHSRAIRQIALRKLDALRIQSYNRFSDKIGPSFADNWDLGKNMIASELDLEASHMIRFLTIAIEISTSLTNGEYSLLHLKRLCEVAGPGGSISLNVIQSLVELSSVPVVRVINLKKRSDRWTSFIAQAFRESISIVRAVSSVNKKERLSINDDGIDDCEYDVWGHHAFDGTLNLKLAEAYEHLTQEIGSQVALTNLVASHWCPNNLKAFDTKAPGTDYLVRTTPSEMACALSHIYSWKGVVRSLNNNDRDFRTFPSGDDSRNIFNLPNHLLRLFKISGFAQGPALLAKNRTMAPVPVCIIVEDDAILCDRFRERLETLLKEIPRDFHFCSIGYSRPKNAPIVPYSTELGIPSMLWYLTGYCLSLAGAEFLLDSLPVIGPVDSFIGLKMASNWDNSYGVAIGVGNYAKPSTDRVHRRDLSKILRFHAYCALHPLCTQKTSSGAKAGGRGWRMRDTDIEYSGYSVPVKPILNRAVS